MSFRRYGQPTLGVKYPGGKSPFSPFATHVWHETKHSPGAIAKKKTWARVCVPRMGALISSQGMFMTSTFYCSGASYEALRRLVNRTRRLAIQKS